MKKETDFSQLTRVAMLLCDAVKIELIDNLPICNHPFTNSQIVVVGKDIVDITEEENYKVWKKQIYSILSKADNISIFLRMVNKPYLLTFLKYAKEYMNEEDFAMFLAEAWILSENPNNDANVKIRELISYFKKANPLYLMTDNDREYFNNLPDVITVYRGVSEGRNPKGLSWTDNKNKAEWFRDRWHKENKFIYTAVIPKKYALAYLNTRNEQEIVVDN